MKALQRDIYSAMAPFNAMIARLKMLEPMSYVMVDGSLVPEKAVTSSQEERLREMALMAAKNVVDYYFRDRVASNSD